MRIAPAHQREGGRDSTIPLPTVFVLVDHDGKTLRMISYEKNLSTSEVQPGSKHVVEDGEYEVLEYLYQSPTLIVYIRDRG